jgi:hypothetical protein
VLALATAQSPTDRGREMAITIHIYCGFILLSVFLSDTHQGRVWDQSTQPELVAKPLQRRELNPRLAVVGKFRMCCRDVYGVALFLQKCMKIAGAAAEAAARQQPRYGRVLNCSNNNNNNSMPQDISEHLRLHLGVMHQCPALRYWHSVTGTDSFDCTVSCCELALLLKSVQSEKKPAYQFTICVPLTHLACSLRACSNAKLVWWGNRLVGHWGSARDAPRHHWAFG